MEEALDPVDVAGLDRGVDVEVSPGEDRRPDAEADEVRVVGDITGDDGAELSRDPVIPGDRTEIRDRSTTVAMQLLQRVLRGEELPGPRRSERSPSRSPAAPGRAALKSGCSPTT